MSRASRARCRRTAVSPGSAGRVELGAAGLLATVQQRQRVDVRALQLSDGGDVGPRRQGQAL